MLRLNGSFLVITLLYSFLAFAVANKAAAGPKSVTSKKAPAYTAIEYLEHFRQASKAATKPNFPERLHFTPLTQIDDGVMAGAWRYILSCSGRRLSVEEVDHVESYTNGFTAESNTAVLRQDGIFESWWYPATEDPSGKPRKSHEGKYVFAQEPDKSVFMAWDHGPRFYFYTVDETGDVVSVSDYSGFDEYGDVCKPNEKAQMISVRIPIM